MELSACGAQDDLNQLDAAHTARYSELIEPLTLLFPSLNERIVPCDGPESLVWTCGKATLRTILYEENKPCFSFLSKKGRDFFGYQLGENHATLLTLYGKAKKVQFYDSKGNKLQQKDIILTANRKENTFSEYEASVQGEGWSVNLESDNPESFPLQRR